MDTVEWNVNFGTSCYYATVRESKDAQVYQINSTLTSFLHKVRKIEHREQTIATLYSSSDDRLAVCHVCNTNAAATVKLYMLCLDV